MKHLEGFLLVALAGLAGYTLCAWQPTLHIVQVMDQGKPGKQALHPPCIAKDGSKVPNGTIEDGRICSAPYTFQIIDARDTLITALGQAISVEEGWNVLYSLARRLHNPGMLVYAGQPGASFIGSSPYAAFSTDDAGWVALYADLRAKQSRFNCDLLLGLPKADIQTDVNSCNTTFTEWVAFHWSTGDREKYARDIVADLRGRGLLK